MVTIQRAIDVQRQTVRGPVDSNLDPRILLDEAGEAMMTMHGWSWAGGAEALLDTVAGNSMVLLPAYTGQIESVYWTGGSPYRLEPTTKDAISRTRYYGSAGDSIYSYTVRWADFAVAGGTVPVPALELAPVPTVSQSGALRVNFWKGWASLEGLDDAAVIPIPPWMTPLYLECVKAVALGYMRENEGTVFQRIDALALSRTFRNIQAHDGSFMPSIGANENTYLQQRTLIGDPFIDMSAFGGPT